MALQTFGKATFVLLGAVVSLLVALIVWGEFPRITNYTIWQVVLIVATLGVGIKIAFDLAASQFPDYNAAKVRIDGPITASSSGGISPGPDAAGADEITEQIERADADDGARALVVELDTPGGQPVASDDIRAAAAEFDGPTVAYAKDICASGGYMIACGCEDFFAREYSTVGSIGVLANQAKFSEFAEEHGITHERFTGGRFKDTLHPLKELEDEEREYFQGVIDSSYESFVDLVAEARDLDPGTVSDTEAKVYHAPEALEAGLVDHVGDRDDFEALLEDRMDVDEVSIEEFEPERSLTDRVGIGTRRAAHAFGRGLASVLTDRDGSVVEFRR